MKLIQRAVFAACLVGTFARADSSGQTVTGSFSNGAGSRNYSLYVPAGTSRGLLLVLHGCFMTPDQMAQGTLLNAQAAAKNFLVLYPEQTSADNSWSCWNWFQPDSQTRGTGEASILAGMTRQVIQTYGLDPSKIYVAGLSAGAAQAANLLACYSDLFSGGLLESGLEYAAAQNQTDANTVMSSGPTRDLDQEAAQAFQCSPPRPKPLKIIVVHGSADPFVAPVNGNRTFTSFSKLNALIFKAAGGTDAEITASQSTVTAPPGKDSAQLNETLYGGQVFVKEYMVQGMGHGWSGGQASVQWMQPAGVDASGLIGAEFFN